MPAQASTLLVTSRELLRVAGEVEYPVPPLAEPEATELFCTRSQLEPSDGITELCRRLDSLPLAVELAAARTKALTPAQILKRLSEHVDLLKGGRDADPRQQTLHATITWSYDLLSPEEQQLFARLSVFAGGCTLEAAEEVCGADLDILQSLVEKSLLRFTASEAGGRYWMLVTIRDYARELLEKSEEFDVIARDHGAWVLAAAERASPLLDVPSLEWLDRLTVEADNVRSALSWFFGAGEPAALGRLTALVWPWWWIRGQMREGRQWLAHDRVRELSVPHDRWENFTGASELAWRQGDYLPALADAEAALEVARELDDRFVANSLRKLGVCWQSLGELDRAEAMLEESARTARDAGDEPDLAAALANIGNIALEREEWERARIVSDEARAISERLGNQRTLVATTFNTGFALLQQGRSAEARPLFVQALLPAIDRAWNEGVIFPVEALAAVAAQHGDAARAAVLLGAAATLREESGLGGQVVESDRLARTRDAAEIALGAAAFRAAYERGSELDLQQAAAEALLVE